MSKEQVEQNHQEALANERAAVDQAKAAKAELDAFLLEEEVEKQAVYYGITEDEARTRIEQNRQERANGQQRTIWPAPNTQGDTQGGAA